MAHLDAEALSEAWLLYKESGYIEYRNRLVLHYTSLVRYVATKVGSGLPAMVDREDLISYGVFGLMDAIEKFDLDKGVKFETYAVRRIQGAIYDEIRALDWVPRSIRSKAKDIDKARAEVEAELSRPAEHAEVAARLGVSIEDYWAMASKSSVAPIEALLATYGDEGDYDTTQDPTANLDEQFGVGEMLELVAAAVNGMDERSKTIVVLYYLHEMTLAEIGRILGVTESRVCQLQSKVLKALGAGLGQTSTVLVA